MSKFCLDYKLKSCDEAQMYHSEQIEPMSLALE